MVTRKRRPRFTGFVRERGGSRSLVVTINGKQYSQAVTVRTLKEAQALLPAFVAEVQSGVFIAAKEAERAKKEAPTFSVYVTEFLKNHTRMDADGDATRRAYRNALGKVSTEIGDQRISNITSGDVAKCPVNPFRGGPKYLRPRR